MKENTELKEAYRQNVDENMYKTILEDALAGYWDWNIVENTAYFSPAIKNKFGYNDNELPNNPDCLKSIIYPEDLLMIADCFEDHVKSRGQVPFQYVGRYMHKNGSTIWIQCTGRVIEWDDDGKPLRMVGGHTDITKHKLIEHNLKVSEKRFKGAFEHSAIGMALVSLEGKWLKVNAQLCNMLGYTVKEFLSRTFMEITHPDDLNLDLQQYNDLLQKKRQTYQMEKRYIHKDGHPIWTLLNVSLILDPDGAPLHFVSQIEDISKRKKNQKDLEALTNTLTRQNNQFANFAYITSHNLRAPVSNLSSLLQMYNALKDPKEKQFIFSKFSTVINHLSETLNILAEAIKIKEDIQKKREELNFEDILQKTRELLIWQLMETAADITYDFSRAPSINYHRPYLESIFLNMLTNTIRYRSPERNPKVHFETFTKKKEIILAISDNGLGIDLKKQKHKIFGLHKTFHRHAEARGVGLFMTKAQVEALGGNITVKSEVNKGTTFFIHFYLP